MAIISIKPKIIFFIFLIVFLRDSTNSNKSLSFQTKNSLTPLIKHSLRKSVFYPKAYIIKQMPILSKSKEDTWHSANKDTRKVLGDWTGKEWIKTSKEGSKTEENSR